MSEEMSVIHRQHTEMYRNVVAILATKAEFL